MSWHETERKFHETAGERYDEEKREEIVEAAVQSEDLDSDVEPVTDHVHDSPWSVNLETPRHAESRDLVTEQAARAVEYATAGNHVNLVTHADCGYPETYLFDALDDGFGEGVSWEYVEQCGCGGHVTRGHVE